MQSIFLCVQVLAPPLLLMAMLKWHVLNRVKAINPEHEM